MADKAVKARYHNNDQLLKFALRRYWNRVISKLNYIISEHLSKILNDYQNFLIQKGAEKRFTPFQTQLLEQWYDENKDKDVNPTLDEKLRLGYVCDLMPEQIDTWFNNKRARDKKRKHNSTIQSTEKKQKTAQESQLEISAQESQLEISSELCNPTILNISSDMAPTEPDVEEEFIFNVPDDSFYFFGDQ